MQRREFLGSAVAGTVAAAQGAAVRPIPKRRYRDNVQLSIIGFGGIVVMGMEQDAGNRLVATAFDRGVNYFDVAPTYGNGEAEIKLGNALRPYRQKVFLACKTAKRDAAGARAELERSLGRLYTDHFDLYQFHAVTTMKDVETILGPGGAGETFLKAKQEGKVKYLGCSAHTEEAAIAMMDRFPLDSILFPINFACFAQANFGPKVIAHAKGKGIARLALKGLAYGVWQPGDDRKAHPKTWYKPIEDPVLARKALRFTLSEDITAAIPPGEDKIYPMALDIGATFKPLSATERKELLASASDIKPVFPQKRA